MSTKSNDFKTLAEKYTIQQLIDNQKLQDELKQDIYKKQYLVNLLELNTIALVKELFTVWTIFIKDIGQAKNELYYHKAETPNCTFISQKLAYEFLDLKYKITLKDITLGGLTEPYYFWIIFNIKGFKNPFFIVIPIRKALNQDNFENAFKGKFVFGKYNEDSSICETIYEDWNPQAVKAVMLETLENLKQQGSKNERHKKIKKDRFKSLPKLK